MKKQEPFLTPMDVLNYCLLGISGMVFALDVLLLLVSFAVILIHVGVIQ